MKKAQVGMIIKNLITCFRVNKIASNKSDIIMEQDAVFTTIYDKCKAFTMTSKERMYALYKATEYLIKADIKGDFVECGVWKGGSMMIIALTLLEHKTTDRNLYLYDTFEGMSEPTEHDYKLSNKTNSYQQWKLKKIDNKNSWCYSSLDEVKQNLLTTHYPNDKIIYNKGKVENTIPHNIPDSICLLRLDTDWYESTKHELTFLYPTLSNHGVLIIDDYGYWAGSKKAVDEYFINTPILLNRIDDTGRIAIKTNPILVQ